MWNFLVFYKSCSVDIDECLTDNGECNQTCTNSYGFFECSCEKGFIITADNVNCNGKGLISLEKIFAASSNKGS